MNTEINEKIFEEFPIMESSRLLFRNFSIKDAHEMLILRSDSQVMEFLDINKYESLQDAEKMIVRVRDSFSAKSGINWAIADRSTKIFMGYFGFWRLFPEQCRAEIGYSLMPKYWSKGYMTETLSRMIDFAFHDLQVHSIEANVNPKNSRSIALLEKAHFKKEAYFRENYLYNGRFYDSVIYVLLETDQY